MIEHQQYRLIIYKPPWMQQTQLHWHNKGIYVGSSTVSTGSIARLTRAGYIGFVSRPPTASTLLTEHPEYKWLEPSLKDMKSNLWMLSRAKR
jgi:hypothetical protein